MLVKGDYGKELILDIHDCNSAYFTREIIDRYLRELCERIGMVRCTLHWWDDLHTPEEEKETEPHLVGISGVQFIKTSNITFHTLPLMRAFHLNIFSCKDFDGDAAAALTSRWFEGKVVQAITIRRM